jgi:hypothetical protein
MIQSRPHHNIIDVLNIMTSENDQKQRMIESDSSSINKPVSQLKVSYSLYLWCFNYYFFKNSPFSFYVCTSFVWSTLILLQLTWCFKPVNSPVFGGKTNHRDLRPLTRSGCGITICFKEKTCHVIMYSDLKLLWVMIICYAVFMVYLVLSLGNGLHHW